MAAWAAGLIALPELNDLPVYLWDSAHLAESIG
jgi:hypothetical protein